MAFKPNANTNKWGVGYLIRPTSEPEPTQDNDYSQDDYKRMKDAQKVLGKMKLVNKDQKGGKK